MEFLLVTVLIYIFGTCDGNVWSARPIYTVERFSLPESAKNVKFPLKNVVSPMSVNISPVDKVTNAKSVDTSVLLSTPTEEPKPGLKQPLPALVKEIPKEHQQKIKALHTPCHQTGCVKGSQCVYDKMWMCPTYIPDLDCSCRPGCAVGNTFIPMGKALTMDECGNRCSCQDSSGEAVCTKRTCVEKTENKETKMDSLLEYLKKLINIKLEENEKKPEVTTIQTVVSGLLQTSASGNVQQRKTTSKTIKLSQKIDLPTKTRFPYNPRRSFYVWT